MKHNILISAFSCLPNRGSEQGVGWKWATEAAKTQLVFVLTRTKSKEVIEKELRLNPIDNLFFIYCDSNSRLRKISIYLEYIHWQFKAYKFLKKYLKNNHFDYLIHITFGTIFLPIWTHKLNVPFIWGPVGGGEAVPKEMYKNFVIKDRIPHIIKNILIKTIKFNPFVIKPAKKAIMIITKTNDTKNVFPTRFHNKIDVRLESCINPEQLNEITSVTASKTNGFINLCFTGRLIAFKNVKLLLDAVIELSKKKIQFQLNIVGEGNQKKFLENYALKHGINNNTIFHGVLNRDETLKLVKECDIYTFPSLREGGTWALMEAMALSKPIICFKHSGMEVLTDSISAIQIEITHYNRMVLDFANAIENLINRPNLMLSLGENAKTRIVNYFGCETIGIYISDFLDRLDLK